MVLAALDLNDAAPALRLTWESPAVCDSCVARTSPAATARARPMRRFCRVSSVSSPPAAKVSPAQMPQAFGTIVSKLSPRAVLPHAAWIRAVFSGRAAHSWHRVPFRLLRPQMGKLIPSGHPDTSSAAAQA
mmetsp:Transcript_21817/g.49163  ORF Transcript_21817/g.49163 Transcript_21817/m.49163 type:complete len:131 (+) Transcript_21817:452-844(+)